MSVVYFTDRDLGRRFPEILRAAGLTVERHDDHFDPQTPDVEWLEEIGNREWIAVSRDKRIRYKPNERDAVIRHRVGLLLVVGDAPFLALADNFVETLPKIERFLESHPPPFIAKIYRPSPGERRQGGRIELWYS